LKTIKEQNLKLTLSLEEVLHLLELSNVRNVDGTVAMGEALETRLKEALMIFYHSKPNILDYPQEEWGSIQEIFKDCIAMEKTGVTPSKEKYGGPGLYA
jgi:hypothetical protein